MGSNLHDDWSSLTEIYIHSDMTPGPDLAGGRPGAQPNYGSISVKGASLGAHKTRGSRP